MEQTAQLKKIGVSMELNTGEQLEKEQKQIYWYTRVANLYNYKLHRHRRSVDLLQKYLHRTTDGDQSLLKCDEHTVSLKLKEVINCTQSDCHCDCFRPRRHHIRSCDRCTHGWVTHAVGKVCSQAAAVCSGQVEIVQSHVVFDISSLILYGTQALPVRMKILLDRLFSVLTHTQVLNIIHTLGWTLRDYVRGYMLQDSMGMVLDRWVTMTPEDEVVTLQQFLRFGETKSIVELMVVEEQRIHSETPDRVSKAAGIDSDICAYVESNSLHRKPRDQSPHGLQHFENLPGGNLMFLQPFHYIRPSTTPLFHSRQTLTVERHPATQQLQRLGLNKQSQSEITSELRGTRNRGRNVDKATGKTNKTSIRSPKYSHDEHRVGDLNTPVRLVEVNSSVPDSSSSVTRERQSGSSLSKGRVNCNTCAKTFYDKGTLKIHFNAVHLKIKHRCTIEGCNMMFSSLRSRNRHSANPNPRLHASVQHTTQPSIQPRRVKMFVTQPFTNTPVAPLRRTSTPPVSMSTHPLVSTATNNTVMTGQLEHQSGSGSGGGATGHLIANRNGLNEMIDMIPKKKPRKSSMPLKIKRENRHDDLDDDDGLLKLPINEQINSRFTVLQRQSINSLRGNKHHSINNPISYSVSGHDSYNSDL
ncbi:zinc finger protein basonuclin-2-like [Myxocyprinus asiaticus]|uniref:zinc finger protein basonuclin-2-like n=1 Tax=Myxocyprinus asiaticus TaxID=70543 RepID=UPI0022231920|nr:zinc finger protein basonuclin-2-like [Myxocyprinus asiaticus]